MFVKIRFSQLPDGQKGMHLSVLPANRQTRAYVHTKELQYSTASSAAITSIWTWRTSLRRIPATCPLRTPEEGGGAAMAEQAMIHITMGEKSGDFASGTTAGQAIRAMLPAGRAERVLCAMQGGICVELSDPLTEDCVLEPLTYQDEEGRRVYERSLRFLFLLSLKRLYPDKRARMLNSVGYGLYLRLLDGEIGHEMARAIEEDMRELVLQDLPFQKEEWTREEAIAYFENEGWLDKAQLLRYRPQQNIRMYRIGPLCEYFYGAMLPSTGMIRAFAVKPHYPGVVLMAPSPANPDEPAPYVSRAKFLREFATSSGGAASWARKTRRM